MEKIKIDHLDIPIIRSCNLACVGCITHSDHKNIKGVVRLNESREWLKFWSDRLSPKSVTLFGGEPLLHPEFVDWAVTVKNLWNIRVSVNTNGYYLENLYARIPEIFSLDTGINVVVSIQTGIEPYLSKVKNDIEILKQKIVDYHLSCPGVRKASWDLWLDESAINSKKWYVLLVNDKNTGIGFTVCEQHSISWTTHYTGIGETMQPVYQYNDSLYTSNHSFCQAKKFVTLYRGRLYKCPPIGVLEHTLTTFNLTKDPSWEPYLQEYKTVGTESTDEEIITWLETQKNPELVCNMCGYSGPKGSTVTPDQRSHVLKNYWNYTL
ncbi:Radical_SAM domain containing protein [uncultured Caudovirales phage]|uniref:Radical_SAM domain containing protein n=1 Tax=uncultured Caudovirales phage TaxID=2100421 RepID=A0A6J5L5J1_9CAUD|nr:Radical_SAM domain containing protein [uncultured Caudovirales phage]